MKDEKDFTQYTTEELKSWFIRHIKGWSGHAVSPKENFDVVMAEMQRRYIDAQNEASKDIVELTKKLVSLTDRLNFLTIILVALTIVSLIVLFFKQ